MLCGGGGLGRPQCICDERAVTFFSGGYFGLSADIPRWTGVSGLAITCIDGGLCHPPTEAVGHLY